MCKKLTKYQQRFSNQIRDLRHETGLSIPLIVDAFNRASETGPITSHTWEMWESTSPRRHREPSVSAYPALATVLGLDCVSELLPELEIKRSDKPLFIPLKTEFFEAFRDGSKRIEYRKYGARWNESHCRVGRTVVLSKGYSGERMTGVIESYRRTSINNINRDVQQSLRSLYGKGEKHDFDISLITIGELKNVRRSKTA